MNGLTRNLMGTAIAIALMVGVIFAMKALIDPVLGGGATVIIMIFMGGVGVAAGLIFLGQHINNLTHRSAGEDITEFAAGLSRARAEELKLQREYARMEREQAAFDSKGQLLDHKEILAQARNIAALQVAAEKERIEAQQETKQAKAVSWMGAIFGDGDQEDGPQFYE